MKLTKIPLSQAVDALRSELTKSLDKTPSAGIVFDIQSVELELQVVAEASNSGKLNGGWSLLGWKMGGEVEKLDSKTGVHTVKMHLKPEKINSDKTTSKVTVGQSDSGQF